MKLALLGHQIGHSHSPSLYRDILGDKLTSYELLDIASAESIPTLLELSRKFNGLNITTPYKRHFFSQVEVVSEIAKELGALNTISFAGDKFYGTNTDAIAVEQILLREMKSNPLHLVILGNGVMAKMTLLIAIKLGIPHTHYHRGQRVDLEKLDLTTSVNSHYQTVVVNACSRDYSFKGKLHPGLIFWDYNYSFSPHESTIPSLVKSYWDGRELLQLQALAAVNFWGQTNPKLKC